MGTYESGTCDSCGIDSEIKLTVLCPECEQSNQLCSDCLDTVDTESGYLYCRECNHVLDIT